ncbi:hypothetical protein SAMN05444166_5665 [Singulisphaera sp. GP187]|uniref:hypothetical protein n=1 Tax=Singulisphaera sp. GP187 TaxID=1882752 RepID=UPI000929C64B|nr:hypothetical protein [Singulisphaera sp. GP187]SIO58399.1 hypothetical protein SAMN05444166_5665 [Singulisphaera sp. GP187]
MLKPRSKRLARLTIAGILACVLAEGGCAFGPKVLERSHGRYNEAVRHVDEEQLLRNLVHMRYNESPLNLNVSSIAAQYELAGGAEARPFFNAPNPAGSTFRSFTSILPDINVSGANRPTLTLIPSDNGDAVEKFLTPITADTLILLQQTSWPVATVLRLWVERLNGVPNAITASGPQRELIPDFGRFRRVTELLQAAQDLGLGAVRPEEHLVEVGGPLPSSAIAASVVVEAAKSGLEYRPRGDGADWVLSRKERRLVLEVNPVALHHPIIEEVAGLLNLRPGQPRYVVVVSPGVVLDPLQAPSPPSEAIQVSPRSTAQVFFYLANGVEVPCEHIEAGLVRLPTGPDGKSVDARAITEGLFAVHACRGHKPPPTAYVAVKYRDYWYYIDDRDQPSKATFALVLSLSRLDFGRQQPGGPLLTLPVGR